jgi:serine acetyltransferase
MSKLRMDYNVYIREHELRSFSRFNKIKWLFLRSTFPIIFFFRLSTSEHILIRFISQAIYKIIRIITGVQIPKTTIIGGGLFLPHYGNIVINNHGVYGEDMVIFQGVTIGAKGGTSEVKGVPTIGNNVSISTNSVILGEVTIGDNSVIGAGAIVVKSIPANSIAIGNPARVIAKKT